MLAAITRNTRTRSLASAANAESKSLSERASTTIKLSPKAAAASRVAASELTLPWLSGFHNTPTRRRPGTASLASATRLGATSWMMVDTPVTLPPGRASDAANPALTGSRPDTITMEIVEVAFAATCAAVEPSAAITLTFICTNSFATSTSRS